MHEDIERTATEMVVDPGELSGPVAEREAPDSERMRPTRIRWTRRTLDIVALALVYFVMARLGQLLAIPPGNITPVWLPSGIILAAVLIRGYHVWPGIFLGAFAGNVWAYFSTDSLQSMANAIFAGTANGTGDVLCAVIGAYLIKRTTGTKDPFERVGGILRFIAYGALLGSAISAFLGVTSLCVAGFVPWTQYLFSLLTWWTGDGVGVLILTPAIIAWAAIGKRPRLNLEALVFALVLIGLSTYSLGLVPLVGNLHLPLFVLVPVLMWSVFRFDRRIAFTSILVCSAMAIIATARGHGPFSGGDLNENLIALQLFMTLMATTICVLHGVLTERRRAEESLEEINLELEQRVAEQTGALAESEEKFRAVFEEAPDSIVLIDGETGKMIEFNDRAHATLGYTREEFGNLQVSDVDALESREDVAMHVEKVKRVGHDTFETKHRMKDGRLLDIQVKVRALSLQGRPLIASIWTDITERKRDERVRETTVGLLRVLNAKNNLHGLMREVLNYMGQMSGCEALGIRLRDGDDFPYYETSGFSGEFVEAERHLCVRDLDGQVQRDEMGNPVLECMCGNIICGRFDPAKPFFTDNGSFVSNETSEMLANTAEEDRQSRTRNRCNGEGYESVALIPLRAGGETFGLMQFNDRRKGCFSDQFMAQMERLADSVAIALAQRQAEEQLAASLKEKEVLLREVHHRVKNNMQVITSLLRMHARRSQSPQVQEVFEDCQSRVGAMALVHEILYQSEDLARIDFGVYLEKLCQNLARLHGGGHGNISVVPEAKDVSLGTDQAVAVGMVVGELVSNAFKHAFPEGGEGRIAVSIRETGEQGIELVVEDNGVGLPADVDPDNTDTLGLKLVSATATGELGGTIEIARGGGTRFTLRFKVKDA